MIKERFQTALAAIFPPGCSLCRAPVEDEFGLCGSCWREVPFISGPQCSACGAPVLAADPKEEVLCEDCLETPRPWASGSSAILYQGVGRQLILSFKHGDRPDLARTFAPWLVQSGRKLIDDETIIAPVPLHWQRMLKRRYNQAALLAQHVALRTGQRSVLDLFVRSKRTKSLDGISVDTRFERLENAIAPNPARQHLVAGKPVLIVDDVMTSGATLHAATHAAKQAGATRVSILALARVCKDA